MKALMFLRPVSMNVVHLERSWISEPALDAFTAQPREHRVSDSPPILRPYGLYAIWITLLPSSRSCDTEGSCPLIVSPPLCWRPRSTHYTKPIEPYAAISGRIGSVSPNGCDAAHSSNVPVVPLGARERHAITAASASSSNSAW